MRGIVSFFPHWRVRLPWLWKISASVVKPMKQSQPFRALIQASPLPIIARDRDAKVQMWNPAAECTFGWTEQEVLSRPYPLVPAGKEKEFLIDV